MSDVKYPECEKLAALRPKIHELVQFLEAMHEKGFLLQRDGEYMRQDAVLFDHEKTARMYYGIDEKKLEQERRHMIDNLPKNTV